VSVLGDNAAQCCDFFIALLNSFIGTFASTYTNVYYTITTTGAKRQLILVLREWYMHPSGQIPAYEWNFGDVNPPVHAWSVLRVYQIEKETAGTEGSILMNASIVLGNRR
jgi:hypothetical protein